MKCETLLMDVSPMQYELYGRSRTVSGSPGRTELDRLQPTDRPDRTQLFDGDALVHEFSMPSEPRQTLEKLR